MLKTDINNFDELSDVEKTEFDETVESISSIISSVDNISVYDEEIIFKSLISEFYRRNTNPEIVEYILKGIYDNISSEKSYKWIFFKGILVDVFNNQLEPNNGFVDLKKNVLAKYLEDEVDIEEIINPLLNILRSYEDDIDYRIELDSEQYVSLNRKQNCVQLCRISVKNNKEYYMNVINAYPENIIIHDNPIMGRNFSILWKNNFSKKPYLIEKKSISEIASELKETGLVLNKQRLDDTLSAIINISIIYELATIRTEIEEDGFYYNANKDCMTVNYDSHEPLMNEVSEALEVLTDLGNHFGKSKVKLATVIKWGLVSAFSFARKQIGSDFQPYLFLHGKASSGKTTMGKIVLFLWSYPSKDNDIGGSSFNTEFRIGEQLRQSSLPILVNEPMGAFKKRNIVEMLKSCVESPISRSRQQGGKFIKKPAYSPVVFTSNPNIPRDDGLIRRCFLIAFTHDEKKDKVRDKELIKEFHEKFKINKPKKSPLLKLHGLSNYCAYLICENPALLEMDWDDLGNYFINKSYEFVGLEPPKWLLEYVSENSDEDNDNHEIEEIRSYLLDMINDKFNHKINLKYYENEAMLMYSEKNLDEQFATDLAGSGDFEKRVFSVINQHLVPFMNFNRKKNGVLYVNFNTLFLKELFDKFEISSASNLKSLSELLGWEYGQITSNKQTGVRMYVEFNKFLDFLYPNYDEVVDDYED